MSQPSNHLRPDEQAALRERIESEQVHHLAARLGINRETLLRLVAGFGVRRCTLIVARAFLEGRTP